MTTTKLCPICQSFGAQHVYTKNGFDIMRCQACQLMFVQPIPTDEELQQHYQNPAYFEGELDQGYASYAAMEKALEPFFWRRLHKLAEQKPQRGELLDFGCAAGYFLRLARQDGWRIAGIELAAEMARQAVQRLDIPVPATLAELPDQQFDAITLWEVIEHLPRPVVQLRELFACLRPGGILMLSTPNTNHWQAVRAPEHWVGYRPPSHLYFFTAQTLADTLTRAGFEQISIERVSPLPVLPAWLQPLTGPLQRGLVTGQAKFWRISLLAWRAIRLLGWGWQKIARPAEDIYTTLEAVAVRPK